MYFAREAVQAGLCPTRTLWFEQPPVGESKSDCLKQGASAVFILSCFSPSSLSNSRKDDPEAGPLDSRLNIGWDKPSRRIQDFVKAVTSRNQQPCFNTASRWRHATAAEISKEPRASKQSHRRNTNQPTWHPRQKDRTFPWSNSWNE